MRFQNSLLNWVGVSAFVTLASGCAVGSASEEEAGTSEIKATVLADIRLEKDHRIQFIETVSGAVSLSETGIPVGEEARLAKLGKLSLQEKYTALGVPIDPATFDKLQAAQERVDALNAETAELEAQGLGPKLEAPLEQKEEVASHAQPLVSEIRNGHYAGYDDPDLFRSAWCGSANLCGTNMSSWNTGFPGDVTFFSSIVMNVGPSGTVVHNHLQYVCLTNIWPIGCVSRGWRTVNSQNLLVGNYGYYSDTYKWTRYSASAPSGSSFHAAATWRL